MADTVEVNGAAMTRIEWKHYIEDCPHEEWVHLAAKLMDGTEISICPRCKQIQDTMIAKLQEGGDFE